MLCRWESKIVGEKKHNKKDKNKKEVLRIWIILGYGVQPHQEIRKKEIFMNNVDLDGDEDGDFPDSTHNSLIFF